MRIFRMWITERASAVVGTKTRMSLVQIVLHAAVSAFGEVCGLGGAAHTLSLGLWISAPTAAISGAVGLGTATGVVIATRDRLFPALSHAARSLSRPATFLMPTRAREAFLYVWVAAVSAAISFIFRGVLAGVPRSSTNIAVGLGATAVALLVASAAAYQHESSLSIDISPMGGTTRSRISRRRSAARPEQEVPTLAGATLSAIAHALGSWPGASRVGLAVAVLIALRARPVRAIQLAIIATVPFWLVDFVRTLRQPSELGWGETALAMLFAFLGALLAAVVLRSLVNRRALIALPAWMLPLACAILAYARAQ